MRAAIVIDAWKEDIFTRRLASWKPEAGDGLTPGTRRIYINYTQENFKRLVIDVRAAEAEAKASQQ